MVANPPSAHLGNPGKSYEILGNPNKVLNNANNVLGNPSEILVKSQEILGNRNNIRNPSKVSGNRKILGILKILGNPGLQSLGCHLQRWMPSRPLASPSGARAEGAVEQNRRNVFQGFLRISYDLLFPFPRMSKILLRFQYAFTMKMGLPRASEDLLGPPRPWMGHPRLDRNYGWRCQTSNYHSLNLCAS